MSSPWLCISCRRRLLNQQTHRQYGKVSRRPQFASNSSVAQQDQSESNRFYKSIRIRKRSASQIWPSRHDRIVEQDFITRIAENHDPATAPYSSPRLATHQPQPSRTASTSSSAPNLQVKPISLRDLRSQLPLASHSDPHPLALPSDDAPASPHADFYSSALAALARDTDVSTESRKGKSDRLHSRHEPDTGGSDDIAQEAPLTLHDARAQWKTLSHKDRPENAEKPPPLTLAAARILAGHWCNTTGHQGPTPANLFEQAVENVKNYKHRKGYKVHSLNLMLWRESLWAVIYACMQPAPKRSLDDLSAQIIKLWSAMLRNYAECNMRTADGTIRLIHSTADWAAFADSEQMRKVKEGAVTQLGDRLATFFPEPVNRYFTKTNGHHVELAALASLVCVQSAKSTAQPTAPKTTKQTKDFIAFLISLAAHTNTMDMLPTYSKDLDTRGFTPRARDDLLRDVMEAASGSVISSRADERHFGATRTKSHDLSLSASNATDWNELFKKRLGKALDARNLGYLNQLWGEIKRAAEPPARTSSSITTAQHVSPVLYAHAMTAFMGLRQPNRAVEVWNTMTAAGVVPSIEHWDAMLKGCGIARDEHAVEDLWVKMLTAGTRPDARVWATRIHSLTVCGSEEAAMAAFQSMAQQWRNAALEQPKSMAKSANTELQLDLSPPKPNTQCLNAVIAGLARSRRPRRDGLLAKAFSLARELDLRLDTYTFNPLFRSALRDGNVALGVRLLQRMQHIGIEADIATFTIMLGSALESGGALDWAALTNDTNSNRAGPNTVGATASEDGDIEHRSGERGNQHAISTLFSLMEKADIRPTAHTYSTLVGGLLKGDSPHISAAYAVLRHVTEQDLPLSPQIYTALTSFHFDQTPPDLTSVEALWHHARAQRSRTRTHTLTLDEFFYDRFVEGWARVGHTTRALEAQQTASRHGVKVAWGPLKMLVSRLIEDGYKEQAQDVVTDAIQGFGKERAQRRGLAEFRVLCQNLGLTVQDP